MIASIRTALNLAKFALVIGVIGPVSAADFDVYTDKNAFLAALAPGYYTETFNTLAVNTAIASPIILNSGTNQFQGSSSSAFYNPSPGGGNVWLSTSNASNSINFSLFAGSPTAIGGYFFLTNINGSEVNGTINANLNAGAAASSVTTSSSTNFIGFVSTNNTSITSLSLSTSASWVTVNDLLVGNAVSVPEPSTYALSAIASGVIAALARRRRSGHARLSGTNPSGNSA